MEVEKLQFKFYDNRTSLSMGKPFFSVFGSVEKSILGHYRCLEFSKLSFFFSENDELDAGTRKYPI